jgi:hypothetical protein
MSNDGKTTVKVVDRGSFLGVLWPIGWLFTIGFCHLSLTKGLFAIVLWPYYLGVALKP